MKYLKVWESFQDARIESEGEDGNLVISCQNQKYQYQVIMIGGIRVNFQKIVQQPNKNYVITASKGQGLLSFSTDIDLAKARYDDILNQFKNFFSKNQKPPQEIQSNPLPNTPGRSFKLILKK